MNKTTKVILGAGSILVVIALFFVFVTKSDSYLAHVFSGDSGQPFFKGTQILAGGDTYVNDKYGISIWSPDLYIVEDEIPTDNPAYIVVATLKSSKPLKSIDIAKGMDTYMDGMAIIFFDIIPDENNPTPEQMLEQVIEVKKEEYAQYPGLSNLESGDITLGNTEGKYLIYTVGGDNQISYTNKEVFTIKDGRLFDLTFSDATDEFVVTEKLADKMFKSFSIN